MTKKELIKALEWFDDDMPVLLMGFYDVSHTEVIRVPVEGGGDVAVISIHGTDNQ